MSESFYTDTISPALKTLLEALEDAFNRDGRKPGYSFIAAGEVAADNCCESGGQLWVRADSMTPVPHGSGPARSGLCKIPMWSVNVYAGTFRCVHTLSDSGIYPTSDQLMSDAENIFLDCATIMGVLNCENLSLPKVQAMIIDRWDAYGPSGGCGGGEWALTFTMAACGCPSKEV